MKKWIAAVAVLLVAGVVVLNAQNETQLKGNPPMLGIHWARGEARPGGGGSPNMTYHGGTVMPTSYTAAIFWGSSWGTSPGDKISGIDTWYSGFGGSNYAATSNEYSGSNGKVGSSVSYGGHYVDTTAAKGGSNTSAILAEVCRVIPQSSLATNGYYAVYTDLKRAGNYCAWHSWGSCNGVNIQFAFFWNLDGDSGCDPQSTVAGQSQGLAALANVSGHELSEARTDPRGDGWFDSSGAENGDKCAWSFDSPSVTFSNGSQWKIQGEWSNAAYNAGTGYPNRSGQNGCLQGQ